VLMKLLQLQINPPLGEGGAKKRREGEGNNVLILDRLTFIRCTQRERDTGHVKKSDLLSCPWEGTPFMKK